jgi:uncharacterized protein
MKKIIDLSNIPVIDAHCHPFDPSRDKGDFRLHFSLSMWDPLPELTNNTVFSYKVMRELGKVLNCKNDDFDKISKERDKVYKNNPKDYIFKLFKAANIDTLVVDTGFPHEEFVGYSVDLHYFKNLVPCKVYPVFRIEPTIYKIFKNFPKTFEDVKTIFNEDIEKAIKIQKVVALKSIIAYASGLEIKLWSEKEAEEAYGRFKKMSYKEFSKHKPGLDEKILRDFFVVMSLKKCHEHDLPMLFHTGMGGAPTLDLRLANPLLMQDLLAVEEIKETKVVLTHSGYPYCQEAAQMVACYPNLYCDVSALSNFFGTSLKSAMLKLLELAPVNRIMFGTDGVTIPESYWMGVLQGVNDVGAALSELVDSGWITSNDALKFGKLILNENAKKLFKL